MFSMNPATVYNTSLMFSITILTIDGCNPEMDEYGVWPETLPGYTSALPCPCADILYSLAGRATRLCRGTYTDGAEWENVNNNQCSTRVSETTAKLCEIPRVSWLTFCACAFNFGDN